MSVLKQYMPLCTLKQFLVALIDPTVHTSRDAFLIENPQSSLYRKTNS